MNLADENGAGGGELAAYAKMITKQQQVDDGPFPPNYFNNDGSEDEDQYDGVDADMIEKAILKALGGKYSLCTAHKDDYEEQSHVSFEAGATYSVVVFFDDLCKSNGQNFTFKYNDVDGTEINFLCADTLEELIQIMDSTFQNDQEFLEDCVRGGDHNNDMTEAQDTSSDMMDEE